MMTNISLVRDLDAYRLLYFTRYNPDQQFPVPQHLMNTFPAPAKSYKMVIYCGVVVLMIYGWSLPSLAYMAYVPLCVPGNGTSPSVTDCIWKNNVPPTELNNIGSMCANIVGLFIYNHVTGRYEDLRNRAQDSQRELETIYLYLAKYTLRKFAQNLKIVQEYCIDMDFTTDNLITKTESWFINFVQLDKHLMMIEEDNLLPIPVKFKEIVDFLNQIGNIRDGFIQQEVPKDTMDKIMEPLEQIYSLLFGEHTSAISARKAIYNLVFMGTRKPNLVSSPIFEVMTNENMAAVIQTYLINNALRKID